MRVVKSLGSVDSTMRKSLYDSVIRHINELAGFPKSVPIVYDEELQNIMQPGSEVGEKSESVIGAARRIQVSVEEERNEHSRTARMTAGHLEDYIYRDDRYQVSMMPIMSAYDTSFVLNFKSPNKSDLVKMGNRFNFRQDQGNLAIMSGGEYFYYIPKDLFTVVIDVHQTASYRDKGLAPVDEYLLGNLAEWVTITTDQSGQQPQFTARHQVSGIQLIFDVGDIKPQKNETYYELEIRINFTYERPTDIMVDHPLYVAGIPLPDQYFPVIESPWVVERTGFKNKLIESADNILANDLFNWPWIYTGEFGGEPDANTSVMFVSDVSPDQEGENQLLLNLNELPLGLTEETLAYLREMQGNDSTLQGSIVRLRYYVNGNIVSMDKVWCDADLNFFSKIPLEVHKQYQISLEVLNMTGTLDKEVLDSLRTHPKFMEQYIGSIYPWLTDPNYPSPDLPRDLITRLKKVNWEEVFNRNFIPIQVLDLLNEVTRKLGPSGSGVKRIHNGTILTRMENN